MSYIHFVTFLGSSN